MWVLAMLYVFLGYGDFGDTLIRVFLLGYGGFGNALYRVFS